MELRHLRYFMAAAEEEHFGRASDRLHVTRPAVSQIIADLESELDTQLFERLAHRVRLTEAGRVLLPRLQGIMGELQDALATAKRVGGARCGQLVIGCGSLTLMHSGFREGMRRFTERYPDIILSIHELLSTEQPQALAEGRLRAGFMHMGPTPDPRPRRPRVDSLLAQDQAVLDSFEFGRTRLGVALPSHHPLAQRSQLRPADLADERFIVIPQGSSGAGPAALQAVGLHGGFEPAIAQEVRTIASQLHLVAAGIGVGLIPVGNFDYPASVAVRPLAGVDHPTCFVLSWVRGSKEPLLDRFIEVMRETLAAEDQPRPVGRQLTVVA